MQTTICPARIDVAVALSFPILLLAAMWFYHPVRVYVVHGEWYVRFSPDGNKQTLYAGEACGFKSYFLS